MKAKRKTFHNISDHTKKSILTRACFSFSDRKGHSTELEMGQDWEYYDNNLEEYLDVFEIDVPDDNETVILSTILEKFGQCCKHRDVFYFWIADPEKAQEPRRIWK